MNFVHDNFFEKGNLKLKVFQLFFTMVLWVLFFIPIFTTFHSVLFQDSTIDWLKWSYREGFSLYSSLERYYFGLFPFLLIAALLLTFRNNYLTENYYKKQYMYNPEKLAKRKAIVVESYDQRFGEKSVRENARYYKVVANKNFEADEISSLFRENSVEV